MIYADLYEDLEPREIVQVDPEYAAGQFGGMFVVVKEVYGYGILGYVIPWGEPLMVRVPFGKFKRTGGRVQWDVWEVTP